MPTPLYDSAANSADVSSGTTVSWNHTVNDGPHRLLLAALVLNQERGVSSVTHGGTAITYKHAREQNMWLYYRVNPPVGTAQIVFTLTSAISGHARGMSLSYHRVNQDADPFRAVVNTAVGGGTSINLSVTTVAGDMVTDILQNAGDSSALASANTAGAGQTPRINISRGTGYYPLGAAMSEKVATGTSTNMSWTISGDAAAALRMIVASIKPGPAGGNQVIWVMLERMKQFYDDLKRGLIPPQEINRRYQEVFI